MHPLTYVTANDIKFRQAVAVCAQAGISLRQEKLTVPEIQAETGEAIIRDKAAKAFAACQYPLVISDDSSAIPALKGFPGPYMKYINDWFTPEDWLRLTKPLTDRRIILMQVVIYIDATTTKLFSVNIPGQLLPEIRGTSPFSMSTIISYDGGKTSSAEHHEHGQSATASIRENVWQHFTDWYSTRTDN